jgi:hypothetical protein
MYQPGIPTGTVNLDVDYQNLKDNFQQLDTTFGVDHIKFSQGTNNGFHTVVHLVNQNADPVASTAAGQIYSKLAMIPPGGDSQLFFETPLGGVEQISGHLALANGYGWFSGMLIQWGFVNGSHAGFFSNGDTGTVTFNVSNVNFPTNCFNVFIQPAYTNPAPTGVINISVRSASISTTGFQWAFIGPSNQYSKFFWAAIGN